MSKALQTREIAVAEGDVLDPEGPPPSHVRGDHIFRLDGNRRGYVLSTIPARMEAGQTLRTMVRPRGIFKPDRLMLPSEVASCVAVIEVKVGNKVQLGLDNEADGEIFSTRNPAPFKLNLDVVMPHVDLSIEVRNKKAFSIEFVASFSGILVQ